MALSTMAGEDLKGDGWKFLGVATHAPFYVPGVDGIRWATFSFELDDDIAINDESELKAFALYHAWEFCAGWEFHGPRFFAAYTTARKMQLERYNGLSTFNTWFEADAQKEHERDAVEKVTAVVEMIRHWRQARQSA